MTMIRTTFAALLLVAALAGCSGENSVGGSDCVSHYEMVATGSSWTEVRAALLGYDDRGPVRSVRTQAHGVDIPGTEVRAVRVVDLLNHTGRRVVQVNVWRTDGVWRAGIWHQCID